MKYFAQIGRGCDYMVTLFLSLKILKPIKEYNDLDNYVIIKDRAVLVWIGNGT